MSAPEEAGATSSHSMVLPTSDFVNEEEKVERLGNLQAGDVIVTRIAECALRPDEIDHT